MAGAGKAFIKHSKPLSPPEQVHDNGFGHPPHPLVIREGMRFFPRKKEPRKPAWPLTVRSAPDEQGKVRCRRDEPTGPVDVEVSASWLLARRADGQGSHVQFAGWAPRKYRTCAQVVEVVDGLATLVLPEWHPARPVPLDGRLLPQGARCAGAWLQLRADLSAGRAAKLSPSHLKALTEAPKSVHPVAYTPPARAPERPRPDVGEGCGDIVLTVDTNALETAPRSGGLIELYVYRRPEATLAGDWAYIAPIGEHTITQRLRIRETRALPVGALVRCDPHPQGLRVAVPYPAGERHSTRWTWRWFSAPSTDMP